MTIPGFTSTGSKRPEVLFGGLTGSPRRMVRAAGCRIWDDHGGEYIDTIMALGAVALGYGHSTVVSAAERAVRDGTVGSLPPLAERDLAERLAAVIPGAESVRFMKTGAEAVAAAVRIARVHTGRERVISCGYHGWLDWCQETPGVPQAVTQLRHEVPFNDVPALVRAIEEFAPTAAIVIEPVVDGAPDPVWLQTAREAATKSGAVLVFDETKTAFRIAVGGAAERYGVVPDVSVIGKAFGNGFPIAAACGPADLMEAATRTWISSTLATEYVSLAAARAVIEVFEREKVVEHLNGVGGRLERGLEQIAVRHPRVCTGVAGIPEMCYLQYADPQMSALVAVGAAARGVLFKRTAYNFVSLAHSDDLVDDVLERLDSAVEEVERKC